MRAQNAKSRRKKKWLEASPVQTTNQTEPESFASAEYSPAAPSPASDDLLLIAGIGPVTEMALHSIGIERFQDFAGHTPESLAQALQKRSGISISTVVIESQDWIGRALSLARQAVVPSPISKEPEPFAEAQTLSPYAGQTQSNVAADPQPPLSDQENRFENAATPAAGIQIQKVCFAQMESPADTESGTDILRAEITWTWAGDPALANTATRLPLCFQIYATDMLTQEAKLLAAHSRPWSHGESEDAVLFNFRAPAAGRYLLQTIAFSLNDSPAIACHRGPRLHIVS